jgi:hypothetical protein
MFLRTATAALLVCASLSQAMAEDVSPLPAGKPAGTHDSALAGGGLIILLGFGAIIAATAIFASQSQNKGATTPTATGTAP